MALEKMRVIPKPLSGGTEILYNDGYLGDAVTLDETAFTDGICLAGTPVTADGRIAAGADVFGILLKDVYQRRPQGTAVIGGYIAKDRAERHSGVKISGDMMDALKNVAFL